MNKTSRTDVTRKNREVKDDAWIKEMLRRSKYGVFGTALNNEPYLNSNLFIYDEENDCIYFHTAGHGRLKTIVEKNPKAVFTVFNMGEMITGPKSAHFSVEYESVVVYGEVSVVTETNKIVDILSSYFKKYTPHLTLGKDVENFSVQAALEPTVFVFKIEEYSGKRNMPNG